MSRRATRSGSEVACKGTYTGGANDRREGSKQVGKNLENKRDAWLVGA